MDKGCKLIQEYLSLSQKIKKIKKKSAETITSTHAAANTDISDGYSEETTYALIDAYESTNQGMELLLEILNSSDTSNTSDTRDTSNTSN
ncbi:16571_t:CDS:2 [Acaulospora morrowiae]|uniref:16571_t:CDS:1 n=1 Tax=Acaulospora morrowiae TaxID=94023 RepID=A0A9N9FQE7_9GLOM|nr:16571_t:CDS:2 [Acaulospora morrowiae]